MKSGDAADHLLALLREFVRDGISIDFDCEYDWDDENPYPTRFSINLNGIGGCVTLREEEWTPERVVGL